MAIVTISQIQHRRGILGSDPMPQLNSAELGWAIDKQELYIGNGTIAEGAPYEGNTRILTEHSNLIALLSDYTYSGPFTGAAMQTGADPATPITRTFIERYDDNVSVRSFGALGDGVTDDYAAINRAIEQHTLLHLGDNRYWTTIYLPAGTYLISQPLVLPPRVRLVGDGPNSTIIELSTPTSNVVGIVKTQDPNSTNDIYPEDIRLVGMTLRASSNSSDVLRISDAKNIVFEHVEFAGSVTDTTVTGPNNSAVLIQNTIRPSEHLVFINCSFRNTTYGVTTSVIGGLASRQDVYDLTLINPSFFNHYKGMMFGNNVIAGSVEPRNIRVLTGTFDKIAKEGIHLYKTTSFTSYGNHFADVGNDQQGAGNPTTPCIVFGDYGVANPVDTPLDLTKYENNYSIGDHFDRNDTDNAVYPRIKSSCLKSYVIAPDEIKFGTYQTEVGRLVLLDDGQTTPAPTGIVLSPAKYHGAIIDYQLNRDGDQKRTGTLRITFGPGGISYTDDYDEVQPVGIDFTVDLVANEAVVNYTSTSELKTCVLSYSIRHLTCVAALPTTVIAPPPAINPPGPINNIAPAGDTQPVPPLVSLQVYDPTYQYGAGSTQLNTTSDWASSVEGISVTVDGDFDTLLWTIQFDPNSTQTPASPSLSMFGIADADTINPTITFVQGLDPLYDLYLLVTLTATNSVTGDSSSDSVVLNFVYSSGGLG